MYSLFFPVMPRKSYTLSLTSCSKHVYEVLFKVTELFEFLCLSDYVFERDVPFLYYCLPLDVVSHFNVGIKHSKVGRKNECMPRIITHTHTYTQEEKQSQNQDRLRVPLFYGTHYATLNKTGLAGLRSSVACPNTQRDAEAVVVLGWCFVLSVRRDTGNVLFFTLVLFRFIQ